MLYNKIDFRVIAVNINKLKEMILKEPSFFIIFYLHNR